jgi:nitrogen-specific signal transduction histidine kinase
LGAFGKNLTNRESFLVEKFFPFFAHEIRNPLQAMGGALTIIERRSDRKDPTLTQSIQIIKEEVQQLTQFVQECLEFTRPPDKTQWREMDVNEIIKAVLNILNFIHKEFSEKIRVKTIFDPHLVKIIANYEEIKKVLINIIRNSFESMAESRKKELIIKTAVQKTERPPGWRW